MKKISLYLLIACFLILFQNASDACWGFRAMGMGGIFTAVADDANAAYWNRAGLAQFDNWKNGQSQIILTNHIFDNVYGFFTRKERLGNAYYDSFHYAMKINKNYGWSLSGEWSGGGALAFSPSFGFRLPWNNKMSVGIGYFLFKSEGYVFDDFGNPIRIDSVQHEIHVDYLWRINPEWSFGVHGENFWALSGSITSPDIAGEVPISGGLLTKINVRPAIAWSPSGRLKGLIVNAGFYDFLGKYGGPYYSFGFEYTPQKESARVYSKSKQKWSTVSKETFLSRSSFRMGAYNLANSYVSTNQTAAINSAITWGYGYKINSALDIGYFGAYWIDPILSGVKNHSIGLAYKF